MTGEDEQTGGDGVWFDEGDWELRPDSDEVAAAVEEASAPPPVLAVVGRPNVGKSTLVNRILGRREATRSPQRRMGVQKIRDYSDALPADAALRAFSAWVVNCALAVSKASLPSPGCGATSQRAAVQL